MEVGIRFAEILESDVEIGKILPRSASVWRMSAKICRHRHPFSGNPQIGCGNRPKFASIDIRFAEILISDAEIGKILP